MARPSSVDEYLASLPARAAYRRGRAAADDQRRRPRRYRDDRLPDARAPESRRAIPRVVRGLQASLQPVPRERRGRRGARRRVGSVPGGKGDHPVSGRPRRLRPASSPRSSRCGSRRTPPDRGSGCADFEKPVGAGIPRLDRHRPRRGGACRCHGHRSRSPSSRQRVLVRAQPSARRRTILTSSSSRSRSSQFRGSGWLASWSASSLMRSHAGGDRRVRTSGPPGRNDGRMPQPARVSEAYRMDKKAKTPKKPKQTKPKRYGNPK